MWVFLGVNFKEKKKNIKSLIKVTLHWYYHVFFFKNRIVHHYHFVIYWFVLYGLSIRRFYIRPFGFRRRRPRDVYANQTRAARGSGCRYTSGLTSGSRHEHSRGEDGSCAKIQRVGRQHRRRPVPVRPTSVPRARATTYNVSYKTIPIVCRSFRVRFSVPRVFSSRQTFSSRGSRRLSPPRRVLRTRFRRTLAGRPRLDRLVRAEHTAVVLSSRSPCVFKRRPR